MATPVEALSDIEFIEKLERAHDQNPLFQHRPDNLARLFRIAGLDDTARHFEVMIERVNLPSVLWVCQQAKARLAGVSGEAFEAVMAERSLILSYLKDVAHNTIGDHAKQRVLEAIETISSGQHRSLRDIPEPAPLVEERVV